MIERGIGHLPVVEAGRPVGIVTRTNLLSLARALHAGPDGKIARAGDDADARLSHRAGAALSRPARRQRGGPHVVTRLVTDVTDALTRRLLALAEAELGPPPVPYLWAVCGSQGRQEQTGVSDQDNCLILDDPGAADTTLFRRPRQAGVGRAGMPAASLTVPAT